MNAIVLYRHAYNDMYIHILRYRNDQFIACIASRRINNMIPSVRFYLHYKFITYTQRDEVDFLLSLFNWY